MEETAVGCSDGSCSRLVREFIRNTPVLLLDKHRHHTREVGYVIQQCTAKACLAAIAFSELRYLWSEESLFVTGSVVEGASLARLFSDDCHTSREFEIDMMLTLSFNVDEALISYVDDNKLFAHIRVDLSLRERIKSLLVGEDTDSVVTPHYLNCYYFKGMYRNSPIFCDNPLYRLSVLGGEFASRSASIPTSVDELDDEVDDTGERSNSTAKLFDFALQLKPHCENFEATFEAMLKRVSMLRNELTELRCGDVSGSLYDKSAKALEWAKTCMHVTDAIFDCRQRTLCTFMNKSTGIDLSAINDRPHQHVRCQLEHYVERLSVTRDDISDSSVAASVCQVLDEIENTSETFLYTFKQLVSDITTFSNLVSFGQQNPQLCRIPPSLEQLSGIIKRYSVDCMPCIKLTFWPSVAGDWKTRERLWPDQSVVEKIVSQGAHLVGKAFCHDMIDWRLSFSVAEINLATLWSPVQHFVYFVFKSLFYKFIKPLADATNDNSPDAPAKKYLTSYLAKTLMLWTSESFDQSWWTEVNAGECLTVLLLALQSSFETRTLHHYFVPTVNLLEGHPDVLATRVIDRVDFILADTTAVCNQLKDHFEKTEIFLNAMPEEAKSARDILSLLNVISFAFNIDSLLATEV